MQAHPGRRFKYNAKFPADQPSDVFWFKSQNIDNFLRSFLICIPLLDDRRGVHAVGLRQWLRALAELGRSSDLSRGLAFVAPMIHEVHFFCVHRLIHWPLLYKWVHSVHHNSINPSPWSSLSMHPVEALLYHGVAFWHLVIPSNPIVALFQLHIAGFGALNGHIGFDKLELTEDAALDSHAYAHYLHHKYFEVNYGGDGLIPLDKWFGTWHDGTKDGDARMQARFEKKTRAPERQTAACALTRQAHIRFSNPSADGNWEEEHDTNEVLIVAATTRPPSALGSRCAAGVGRQDRRRRRQDGRFLLVQDQEGHRRRRPGRQGEWRLGELPAPADLRQSSRRTS